LGRATTDLVTQIFGLVVLHLALKLLEWSESRKRMIVVEIQDKTQNKIPTTSLTSKQELQSFSHPWKHTHLILSIRFYCRLLVGTISLSIYCVPKNPPLSPGTFSSNDFFSSPSEGGVLFSEQFHLLWWECDPSH
jgi:hypothetical protein